MHVAQSGCAPAQLWDTGRAGLLVEHVPGLSGPDRDRGGNFWPKVGHSVSPAVSVLTSEVHEVCLGLLAGCL